MGHTAPLSSQTDPPPPKPARVVLLLQDLAFGGTQSQSLELAQGLDPARFEVEIWTLMAGDDLVEAARRRGLRVRRLGRAAWVTPAALLRLGRALAAEPVDILVLLTVVPNIWGRLLGRLTRVPKIVATCRGGGSIGRQHERLLYRLADHIICNSVELQERLRAIYRARPQAVSRIANGVDTRRWAVLDYPTDQEEVLFCLARLVPDKDHATLLAAFARLVPDHPRARLVLAGDGPLRRNLADQAQTLGIAGQVDFLGAVDDPVPWLQKARVLVLASKQEAMPNAVLEAMACGRPVAATRVGGLPELLGDSGAGLLVNPGDDVALAAALARLLDDPAEAASMGRAGRRAVEEGFSLQAMVQGHQQLFSRLLDGS